MSRVKLTTLGLTLSQEMNLKTYVMINNSRLNSKEQKRNQLIWQSTLHSSILLPNVMLYKEIANEEIIGEHSVFKHVMSLTNVRNIRGSDIGKLYASQTKTWQRVPAKIVWLARQGHFYCQPFKYSSFPRLRKFLRENGIFPGCVVSCANVWQEQNV